ncbi:hypothetical protein SAMN02983003_0690 [Devosia enhydra]|uniref:Uncharacterized protein n=1 Tax=Devosia enhydra TaxID=665118 RepID=A0A1K2HTW5_9HYPH|nr:hypothetical protein [Devosia enhydra]SFZ81784.1 hypothetical protein SAMN02983003_0690 [Devosia enhydra]
MVAAARKYGAGARRVYRAPDDQARRHRLRELLCRGDAKAAAAVIDALPRPLPARLPSALRDGAIVAAADWLAMGWPSLSQRQLAEIIGDMGDALERGGTPRAESPAMSLAPADRAELRERLAPALGWAPWPGTDRIRRLLRENHQRGADVAKRTSGA